MEQPQQVDFLFNGSPGTGLDVGGIKNILNTFPAEQENMISTGSLVGNLSVTTCRFFMKHLVGDSV